MQIINNTMGAATCNICATWYEGTAELLSDRIEIALITERCRSIFFFFSNLLAAPQTVSNACVKVARVQSCTNH